MIIITVKENILFYFTIPINLLTKYNIKTNSLYKYICLCKFDKLGKYCIKLITMKWFYIIKLK